MNTPSDKTEYVYLGNIPIAVYKNNSILTIHADHLNTPRQLSDNTKKVVWNLPYTAFGENIPKTVNNTTFNLRYPRQYYDAESKLHYNINRYYDPLTGRYTQSNPIGLSGGINTYTYVGGNAVGRVDPRGLDVFVANTAAVLGLHQKIVVNTPNGLYGQSFGMSDRNLPQQGIWDAYNVSPQKNLSGSGVVYIDNDPITKIQRFFKTTAEEDALIESYLKGQLGNTGPYNVASNNCRDYSNEEFDKIVDSIKNLRNSKNKY